MSHDAMNAPLRTYFLPRRRDSRGDAPVVGDPSVRSDGSPCLSMR